MLLFLGVSNIFSGSPSRHHRFQWFGWFFSGTPILGSLHIGPQSKVHEITLWWFNIAIENGHLSWIYPLKMVIFNSYVSLPEGMVWDQKYDARNLQTLALFCSLESNMALVATPITRHPWEPENREQYLKGRSARVAAGSTFLWGWIRGSQVLMILSYFTMNFPDLMIFSIYHPETISDLMSLSLYISTIYSYLVLFLGFLNSKRSKNMGISHLAGSGLRQGAKLWGLGARRSGHPISWDMWDMGPPFFLVNYIHLVNYGTSGTAKLWV